ncbi:GNAT family N-acetyltransferase [Brachybacterium sp. EF45031]|uniref:GNAT family N-acetyltransferase n=1 Tax=Brachybacterium sillae TaxID=2810536 RepID=UPI00217F0EA7|nr:GNAT family protein [Brachybacterium sillae]MCS6711363.1 GNAT family N-acetyltransferase [Brachybacterium sillae]
MRHELALTRGPVRLRPLDPAADAAALRALVDADSWAGMSVPLPSDDTAMRGHLENLVDRAGDLFLAVELDGRFVGRTALYDVAPGLRTEIGHTIYARDARGGVVNPTAKLLLMQHSFEVLQVGRVALRCDHRNERSRRAILRLGARYEGTLRAFRPAADGTVADVDYFSVLAAEWPAVRDGLEERLRTAGRLSRSAPGR